VDFHFPKREGRNVKLQSRFTRRASRVTIGDAGLVQVVLRHLDVHLVADGNADEIFAHLAGDVREDLVTVGQFDTKHGARQHLCDGSGQFDVLFSWHGERQNFAWYPASAAGKNQPFDKRKTNGHSPLIRYIQHTVYEK
jgi:hypothetical protein